MHTVTFILLTHALALEISRPANDGNGRVVVEMSTAELKKVPKLDFGPVIGAAQPRGRLSGKV